MTGGSGAGRGIGCTAGALCLLELLGAGFDLFEVRAAKTGWAEGVGEVSSCFTGGFEAGAGGVGCTTGALFLLTLLGAEFDLFAVRAAETGWAEGVGEVSTFRCTGAVTDLEGRLRRMGGIGSDEQLVRKGMMVVDV